MYARFRPRLRGTNLKLVFDPEKHMDEMNSFRPRLRGTNLKQEFTMSLNDELLIGFPSPITGN